MTTLKFSVFDLYIYHILVHVIVQNKGDEPPKNSRR